MPGSNDKVSEQQEGWGVKVWGTLQGAFSGKKASPTDAQKTAMLDLGEEDDNPRKISSEDASSQSSLDSDKSDASSPVAPPPSESRAGNHQYSPNQFSPSPEPKQAAADSVPESKPSPKLQDQDAWYKRSAAVVSAGVSGVGGLLSKKAEGSSPSAISSAEQAWKAGIQEGTVTLRVSDEDLKEAEEAQKAVEPTVDGLLAAIDAVLKIDLGDLEEKFEKGAERAKYGDALTAALASHFDSFKTALESVKNEKGLVSIAFVPGGGIAPAIQGNGRERVDGDKRLDDFIAFNRMQRLKAFLGILQSLLSFSKDLEEKAQGQAAGNIVSSKELAHLSGSVGGLKQAATQFGGFVVGLLDEKRKANAIQQCRAETTQEHLQRLPAGWLLALEFQLVRLGFHPTVTHPTTSNNSDEWGPKLQKVLEPLESLFYPKEGTAKQCLDWEFLEQSVAAIQAKNEALVSDYAATAGSLADEIQNLPLFDQGALVSDFSSSLETVQVKLKNLKDQLKNAKTIDPRFEAQVAAAEEAFNERYKEVAQHFAAEASQVIEVAQIYLKGPLFFETDAPAAVQADLAALQQKLNEYELVCPQSASESCESTLSKIEAYQKAIEYSVAEREFVTAFLSEMDDEGRELATHNAEKKLLGLMRAPEANGLLPMLGSFHESREETKTLDDRYTSLRYELFSQRIANQYAKLEAFLTSKNPGPEKMRGYLAGQQGVPGFVGAIKKSVNLGLNQGLSQDLRGIGAEAVLSAFQRVFSQENAWIPFGTFLLLKKQLSSKTFDFAQKKAHYKRAVSNLLKCALGKLSVESKDQLGLVEKILRGWANKNGCLPEEFEAPLLELKKKVIQQQLAQINLRLASDKEEFYANTAEASKAIEASQAIDNFKALAEDWPDAAGLCQDGIRKIGLTRLGFEIKAMRETLDKVPLENLDQLTNSALGFTQKIVNVDYMAGEWFIATSDKSYRSEIPGYDAYKQALAEKRFNALDSAFQQLETALITEVDSLKSNLNATSTEKIDKALHKLSARLEVVLKLKKEWKIKGDFSIRVLRIQKGIAQRKDEIQSLNQKFIQGQWEKKIDGIADKTLAIAAVLNDTGQSSIEEALGFASKLNSLSAKAKSFAGPVAQSGNDALSRKLEKAEDNITSAEFRRKIWTIGYLHQEFDVINQYLKKFSEKTEFSELDLSDAKSKLNDLPEKLGKLDGYVQRGELGCDKMLHEKIAVLRDKVTDASHEVEQLDRRLRAQERALKQHKKISDLLKEEFHARGFCNAEPKHIRKLKKVVGMFKEDNRAVPTIHRYKASQQDQLLRKVLFATLMVTQSVQTAAASPSLYSASQIRNHEDYPVRSWPRAIVETVGMVLLFASVVGLALWILKRGFVDPVVDASRQHITRSEATQKAYNKTHLFASKAMRAIEFRDTVEHVRPVDLEVQSPTGPTTPA